MSVPIVSTKAMMKMVSTTGSALGASAPRRSICAKIGARLAGAPKTLCGHGATRVAKAISAVMTIPSSSAPGTSRITIAPISRKPKMATSTGAEVRAPALTGAPAMPSSTMPVWFSPIKVRKSPMPTAKL